MSKHTPIPTGTKSYIAGMFSFMILSWSVVFIPEIVYDVMHSDSNVQARCAFSDPLFMGVMAIPVFFVVGVSNGIFLFLLERWNLIRLTVRNAFCESVVLLLCSVITVESAYFILNLIREYAPMWLTGMPADGNGMYSNVPLWAQPPVSASYGIVLMFLVYRLYRKFRPLQG